jgi:adenosylcobinamide-GDP ribazoletransferase
MFGYLPFVGIAIGAAAGLAALGFARLGVAPLSIATAFAAPILLTGALHLDGFLDSCDALFACVTPERRLEIMKDPHHGTFAVAYFAVIAAIWIGALAALPFTLFPWVLALACGSARWAATLNGFAYPYARGGHPSIVALVAAAAVLIVVSRAIGPWDWLVLPALTILSLGLGRWCAQRLGGKLVGDVYGALIFVGEAVALVTCAVISR